MNPYQHLQQQQFNASQQQYGFQPVSQPVQQGTSAGRRHRFANQSVALERSMSLAGHGLGHNPTGHALNDDTIRFQQFAMSPYSQSFGASQSTFQAPVMSRCHTTPDSRTPFRSTTGTFTPLSVQETMPVTSPGEPLFNTMSNSSPIQRLPSVPEDSTMSQSEVLNIGRDPAEWIHTNSSALPFLTLDSTYPGDYLATGYAQPLYESVPPSMISGPTGHEEASPLTPQDSSMSYAGPILGPEMMFRHDSVQSQPFSPSWGPGLTGQLSRAPSQKNSLEGSHDFMGLGTELSYAAQQPVAHIDSSPTQPPGTAEMVRSGSDRSTASGRSDRSQRQRLQAVHARQVENSKSTNIAPKPGTNAPSMSSIDVKKNKFMSRKSKRTPYQRPKKEKLPCPDCPGQTFRGKHELDRHVKAKHHDRVVKWVITDPALRGKAVDVDVVVPLKDCPACRSGKMYGAYYNAAAHLRRKHYNPRVSRNQNNGAPLEKRGGNGGGSWPHIDIVKHWLEERPVEGDLEEEEAEEEDEDSLVSMLPVGDEEVAQPFDFNDFITNADNSDAGSQVMAEGFWN